MGESPSRLILACAVCLLFVLSPAGGVSAQATSYAKFVRSTVLSVYSDGSAEVNQTAIITQNATSLSLPLLSSQVGNLLALDQDRSPLSYQLSGQNLTIYTLAARWVSLSYDTNALTAKQGPLWTLTFASPFNMTLVLPLQATVLSLSGAPASISTNKGSPTLVLGSGSWEVSYGLPISTSPAPITSTSATSSSSSAASGQSGSYGSQPGTPLPLTISGVLIGAVAVVIIGVAAVARGRRKGIAGFQGLRFGDAEMLHFIKEKGGRAIEAEIREHFSLPRTSAWRQARRLERLGYIRIHKIGSQNQVELVRQDFDQSQAL